MIHRYVFVFCWTGFSLMHASATPDENFATPKGIDFSGQTDFSVLGGTRGGDVATALLGQVAIAHHLRDQNRELCQQNRAHRSRIDFLVGVINDNRADAHEEIGALQVEVSCLNRLVAQLRAESDGLKNAFRQYAKQGL